MQEPLELPMIPRMQRRQFLAGGWAALAVPGHALDAIPPQRREFVAPHMGTLWRLVFFEADAARAAVTRDSVWARLTELNSRLSDYIEQSELSRLAREGRLEAPSDDLRRVLAAAASAAEATGGAFDITVGPLVRLWRTARREKQLPDPKAIAAARALVDWRAIELTDHAVIFHSRGGRLDLGGIAKGFAQDEVLRLVRDRHGVQAALIDAGGGISVSDAPPGQQGWTAGLDTGSDTEHGVTLTLKHQSLATSGDTRQFVEIEGVRYSHIVDPSTGLGLTQRVQASVVAAEGATADALATACCVMGEEKTRAFLKRQLLAEARLQTVTPDGRPRTWESRGFARMAQAG